MAFRVVFCYSSLIMAKNSKKQPLTVSFVALGCPKNMVDSESMLARIGQADYVISGNPDNADVIVINTCGFIAPAKAEAIEAIRQAVSQKKKGAVRKVVVTGCLSERMGDALADEVKGIDAIVGLGQRDRIAEIIGECMAAKKSAGPKTYMQAAGVDIHDDRGRLLITPQHWAYLRISEGCNRKCAFCTIPAIRGRFRSKPMEMVLDEAAELVDFGAVELSIIAQDSNYYGKDIGIKSGLSRLIGELEKLPDLQWIRLMYLYPAGIDDGLIETIANSDKVVPYIDMPIQHINNDILKSMRRSDTKERTQALIEKLRIAMPKVTLRTTLITGYPGETNAQFAELQDFIEWAKFDALGCFPFFPEAGTPAALLDGQIDDAVKDQRTDELMALQQRIIFDKMDAQVSSELMVLVDEVDDGLGLGRHAGQAPHIDSICKIHNCTAHSGRFIRCQITGRDGYDILVEQINS